MRFWSCVYVKSVYDCEVLKLCLCKVCLWLWGSEAGFCQHGHHLGTYHHHQPTCYRLQTLWHLVNKKHSVLRKMHATNILLYVLMTNLHLSSSFKFCLLRLLIASLWFPPCRQRLGDWVRERNGLKPLIKTLSVGQIWTFLCLVDAWNLSSCLRELYFVLKMQFLHINFVCNWQLQLYQVFLS